MQTNTCGNCERTGGRTGTQITRPVIQMESEDASTPSIKYIGHISMQDHLELAVYVTVLL